MFVVDAIVVMQELAKKNVFRKKIIVISVIQL
jgi:hypothetical protein